MLKRIFASCLTLYFIALLLISTAHAAGFDAPVFKLPTANGTVDLSSLKNKVVYLDFWASWCGPCRKSFPWMNKMAARYADKGLVIVAVNLDKERDLADTFLHNIPATFTVAFDPDGHIADEYKVQGMPSSYLISRDGKIVETHLGFRNEDELRLESIIRTTLGE